MRGIIKPNVNLISMTPNDPSENVWTIEVSVETLNGKFAGFLELEYELISKSIEKDKFNELIIDELIKELQGREINNK